MIRPRHFGYNTETAENNTFQTDDGSLTESEIESKAKEEFDGLVEVLRTNGVHVDVYEDLDDPVTPDAVFPNNWFSTHEDGALITYPMFSSLRRNERRKEIIDDIGSKYQLARRYAFEQYEKQDLFLEGTGSMVLDRQNKIAYACLSSRTDIQLLDKFCVLRGYSHVVFEAISDDVQIYHTNVVMALGTGFVVICLDCIPSEVHRAELTASFNRTGKEIIAITVEQMNAFAGNMLILDTALGTSVCVMSQQALESLDQNQVDRISQHCKILSSPIYTIETYGGGSARCMIAENFLPK